MHTFDPHAVYEVEDLEKLLPCTLETFIHRLHIPRRINGIILGADICAALERCADETRTTPAQAPVSKILTKGGRRRRPPVAQVQNLEPLNVKTILASREGHKP